MVNNSRRAKTVYAINESISRIKQKASSTTVSRNPATNNRISLNYQSRKKISN